jgi:hypothetical protein
MHKFGQRAKRRDIIEARALWRRSHSGAARHQSHGTERQQRQPMRADIRLADFVVRPSQAMLARYDRVLNDGTLRGDSLRLLAATEMRGAARGAAKRLFNGINAGAIRVAALAPDAAGRVRDLGELSGSARFAGVGGARPPCKPRFASRAPRSRTWRCAIFAGRAAFSDGVLRLTDTTAQSQASTLVASATVDLRRGTSNFNLSAPRIALGAATINPLLRRWGLSITGNTTGRLVVSSGSATTGGATPTNVDFDLALPQTTVRTTARAGISARDALRIAGARLRGRGVLQTRAGRPIWNGQAELVASQLNVASGMTQLARVALPQWITGTQLRDVRLTLRGAASVATTATPEMEALLVASAQMPCPTAHALSRGATRAPVFVAGPDACRCRVSVPGRIARDTPCRCADFERRSARAFHVARQRPCRRTGYRSGLDSARLQTCAERHLQLNCRAPLSRAPFARADLSGTLRDRAPMCKSGCKTQRALNNTNFAHDTARADLQITSTDFKLCP